MSDTLGSLDGEGSPSKSSSSLSLLCSICSRFPPPSIMLVFGAVVLVDAATASSVALLVRTFLVALLGICDP